MRATTYALPLIAMIGAVMAVIACDARDGDGAFVAWWIGALVLAVPLLHVNARRRIGHGTTAIGWLGLLPLVALFAHAACTRALTADWNLNENILFLTIPFVCWALTRGGVELACAAMPAVHAWRHARTVGAAVTIGWMAVSVALALRSMSQPSTSPADVLASKVSPVAPIPIREGTFEIAGLSVERTCHHEARCELSIDGHQPYVPPDGSLEVAEGLGYRFLRTVGSAPRTWLAFEPGAGALQLTARDLGPGIGAPTHIGAASMLTACVAATYLLLALLAIRRGRILAAATPAEIISPGRARIADAVTNCDVSLPVGPAIALAPSTTEPTYRDASRAKATVIAGTRDSLVEERRAAATEHLALALALLVLGSTPALVAISHGLVLRW